MAEVKATAGPEQESDCSQSAINKAVCTVIVLEPLARLYSSTSSSVLLLLLSDISKLSNYSPALC